MPATLSQIGEFGFIDLIRSKMKLSSSVLKGIGDDAALVQSPKNKILVLTTDMLVEGVHFTKDMPAQGIGHKALGCNVSDIAAMGGRPLYALVSLGISGKIPLSFIKKIYEGMERLARRYKISIVGGDTVKSDKMIINVALIGEVNSRQAVLRSGAKVGDWIFVSGPLGKSLSSQWHLKFTPRLKESQYLIKYFRPTAMIDVSDGLAADLGHILEESRVGGVLEEVKIPRRSKASLQNALYDGEDFELIFTLPPNRAKKLLKSSLYQFYCIGEIVKGGPVLRLWSFVPSMVKGSRKQSGMPTSTVSLVKKTSVKDKKGKCRILSKKGFVHF